MNGDDSRLSLGQNVAMCHPSTSALARFAKTQVVLREQLEQGLEARPVVPHDPVHLGKPAEKLPSVLELFLIRSVEADDDLREIGDLAQLVHDVAQRGALKLAV